MRPMQGLGHSLAQSSAPCQICNGFESESSTQAPLGKKNPTSDRIGRPSLSHTSIIPDFYPCIVWELGNRRICDGEGAPALGKQRFRDILGKLSPGFPCLCPHGPAGPGFLEIVSQRVQTTRGASWDGEAWQPGVEAGAVGAEKDWVLGRRLHDKLLQP